MKRMRHNHLSLDREVIPHRRRGVIVMSFAIALLSLVSCLGEPEIDERWTLLEFVDVDPEPGLAVSANQPIDVTLTGRITYRSILTGFLVAEVRYSDTVAPGRVVLDPTEHTLESAREIDRILANSVTVGRITQPVTGWDHLIQSLDLSFTAQVPDSATGRGLYLLLYMAEGDEIRLANGDDSLVVTPFVSTDYEVLHTGFALDINPSGGTP